MLKSRFTLPSLVLLLLVEACGSAPVVRPAARSPQMAAEVEAAEVEAAEVKPVLLHGDSSVEGSEGGPPASEPSEREGQESVSVGSQAAEELAPAPETFADRETVSYGELIVELKGFADELVASAPVKKAHAGLLRQYGLSDTELPLQSFARVYLAFEATRDGGLWGIRWDITNEMPWSDLIWKQWAGLDELSADAEAGQGEFFDTAVAECDEISALFALLARDMGVAGFVGLHWPYWNHTVAVWQVEKADSSSARIVVPTSQIFLSREATLGTRELETRRVVFPYPRSDMKAETEISASLARFLMRRLWILRTATQEELQHRRNRWGGS